MTDTLHQINLNYNPAEDRILIRVSTTGQQEYRVWLTRRFTSIMLDILNKSLTEGMSAESEEAKSALLDWQKKEVTDKADFSKPFIEDNEVHFPLGKGGILAQKLSFSKSGQKLNLLITPSKGQGMNLALDKDLQKVVYKMFEDAVAKAQWQLITSPVIPVSHQSESLVH